jgi:hypothetical protein
MNPIYAFEHKCAQTISECVNIRALHTSPCMHTYIHIKKQECACACTYTDELTFTLTWACARINTGTRAQFTRETHLMELCYVIIWIFRLISNPVCIHIPKCVSVSWNSFVCARACDVTVMRMHEKFNRNILVLYMHACVRVLAFCHFTWGMQTVHTYLSPLTHNHIIRIRMRCVCSLRLINVCIYS